MEVDASPVVSFPLDTPITVFLDRVGASTRIYQIQQARVDRESSHSFVETLGDLCKLSSRELLAVKNLGRKSIRELEEHLAQHGLALADSEVMTKRAAISLDASGADTHVVSLVTRLTLRWEHDAAAVVADWCEERGLAFAAKLLREKPCAEVRAMIDSLGYCLGVKRVPVPRRWTADGWYTSAKSDIDTAEDGS